MTNPDPDRRRSWQLAFLVIVVAAGAAAATCVACRATRFVAMGETRDLEGAKKHEKLPIDEDRAELLVIAIDGLGKEVVYDLLRDKRLPGLAALLGGQAADGSFPHAYFAEDVLSTFPSTTLPAWGSVFSGEPPAVHGVAGNEYFVREERRFAAPAPVSFSSVDPVMAVYTDDYANDLLASPTIYERMRAREPGLKIWVSMSQYYAGADKLLLAQRTVLGEAVGQFAGELLGLTDAIGVYKNLDEEVLEVLADRTAEAEELPQVLTMYLPGIDLYTHQSDLDPDTARTEYLVDVLDTYFQKIHDVGTRRGGLANRWVVLVTDHGHSPVKADGHLLVDEKQGDARAVLQRAGFRVRPFTWKVDDKEDFQAVFAYGGATAYLYLTDRSACAKDDTTCDWKRPPRYREDVLDAAEALHKANATGAGGKAMKGTLDLILVRQPKPYAEVDEPFEVYLGGGKTQPLTAWLAANPRPTYVRFDERMRGLAVGPRGERAGDILLLTNFGNVEHAAERSYFAAAYRSWHGSPSRRDSEVAFIVAHPGREAGAIQSLSRLVLGEHPTLVEVGRLLVRLRSGAEAVKDWDASATIKKGKPPERDRR